MPFAHRISRGNAGRSRGAGALDAAPILSEPLTIASSPAMDRFGPS
jgi:hypothetical protein